MNATQLLVWHARIKRIFKLKIVICQGKVINHSRRLRRSENFIKTDYVTLAFHQNASSADHHITNIFSQSLAKKSDVLGRLPIEAESSEVGLVEVCHSLVLALIRPSETLRSFKNSHPSLTFWQLTQWGYLFEIWSQQSSMSGSQNSW